MMSCKEDELLTYDSETNVYFPNRLFSRYDTRITVNANGVSLGSPEILPGDRRGLDSLRQVVSRQDIAIIPIMIMGNTSDVRRDIAYRVATVDNYTDFETATNLVSRAARAALETEADAAAQAALEAAIEVGEILPDDDIAKNRFLTDYVAAYIAEFGEDFIREFRESYDPADLNLGIEDVDFEILDAYIWPNSDTGVIVMRLSPENVGDGKFRRAIFQLLPNEHFSTNFDRNPYVSGSNNMISTIEMMLSFSDDLMMPQYWNTAWRAIMGDWSIGKIRILANVFNMSTGSDFLYAFPPPDQMLIFAYGAALQRWLLDYREEHGTRFLDDNGQPMRLGNIINNIFGNIPA